MLGEHAYSFCKRPRRCANTETVRLVPSWSCGSRAARLPQLRQLKEAESGFEFSATLTLPTQLLSWCTVAGRSGPCCYGRTPVAYFLIIFFVGTLRGQMTTPLTKSVVPVTLLAPTRFAKAELGQQRLLGVQRASWPLTTLSVPAEPPRLEADHLRAGELPGQERRAE
jgi:hypothetical protein